MKTVLVVYFINARYGHGWGNSSITTNAFPPTQEQVREWERLLCKQVAEKSHAPHQVVGVTVTNWMEIAPSDLPTAKE